MRSPLTALAAAAVVTLLMAACGSAKPAKAPVPAPAQVPSSATSHVAVIVMENEEYGSVIGSRSAPYINSLARRGTVFANSHGVAHPSLPNYLALVSGSTLRVSSDCTDCNQSAPNLADQLESAGLSWRGYMESMPAACFRGGSSGAYAKKHDPFMYFRQISGNPGRCQNVVPASRLSADLRHDTMPAFAFITPNLCDDMHDCGVHTGDRWLHRAVPSLLRGLGPHGFLVLTFDEGSSDAGCCGRLAHGGRIATVLIGPDVRRGARVTTPVTHYSTLRTIEQAFGLPLLGNAASPSTQPLDAAFTGAPHLRKR